MVFDYFSQRVYQNQIDVVDIGNTCLHCTNVEDFDFYLITSTVMGKTSILSIGPFVAETGEFTLGFGVSFSRINYSEKAISKAINSLLNDPHNKIYEVEEITVEEGLAQLPDLAEAFRSTL